MGKQLLLTFLICLPLSLFSQDVERVKINGKIKAASIEDVEGVSIYNVSSQKGTVTNEQGTFEIEVAENDRLSVTALQFNTFIVVVDERVITEKALGIYLNPIVNQLEEVIVRQYNLSGDMVVDVTKIKTANVVPDLDLSYATLEFDYEFTIDKYSSIKGNKALEAYHNGQEQYGGDLIGLFSDVILRAFIPKKRKTTTPTSEKEPVAANLRDRFSTNYISETFGIPEEKVNDFLFYAEENGMQYEFLYEENEIVLLAFLFQKSEAYKRQGE